MSCAQAAFLCNQQRTAESVFQLEVALAASLHREQALISMVEQQRVEIDRLRSTVNSMQLSDALRSLDFTTPPPSVTATPQHTPSSAVGPHDVLNLSMDRLYM